MDTTNKRRVVGEDPKRVFWLLPRPAPKPVRLGEDPKAFFRRMAARQLARLQNQNQAGDGDA